MSATVSRAPSGWCPVAGSRIHHYFRYGAAHPACKKTLMSTDRQATREYEDGDCGSCQAILEHRVPGSPRQAGQAHRSAFPRGSLLSRMGPERRAQLTAQSHTARQEGWVGAHGWTHLHYFRAGATRAVCGTRERTGRAATPDAQTYDDAALCGRCRVFMRARP